VRDVSESGERSCETNTSVPSGLEASEFNESSSSFDMEDKGSCKAAPEARSAMF
jgi:hypothetical protein